MLISTSDKSVREFSSCHLCADSAQNIKDGAALDTLVAKSNVISSASKNSFSMYSYTASLCEGAMDAFFQNMQTFPFFKKFSTDGAYEYAFFELVEDACGQFITVTLFSFKRDITSTDFVVAFQALGISEISDTCKGKAKNSRNKNRTDKIRAMYMGSGASLSEIACAIFGCAVLDADSGIMRPITRKQADLLNRIQSVCVRALRSNRQSAQKFATGAEAYLQGVA